MIPDRSGYSDKDDCNDCNENAANNAAPVINPDAQQAAIAVLPTAQRGWVIQQITTADGRCNLLPGALVGNFRGNTLD
jgi:hypothetical protein